MRGKVRQQPDFSEGVKEKSAAETRGVNHGFGGAIRPRTGWRRPLRNDVYCPRNSRNSRNDV